MKKTNRRSDTTYGETKPVTIKKKKNQDPKEVAAKQKHEIAFIAKRFGASQKLVRHIRSVVGKSRSKIYAELIKLGYKIIKQIKKQKQ